MPGRLCHDCHPTAVPLPSHCPTAAPLPFSGAIYPLVQAAVAAAAAPDAPATAAAAASCGFLFHRRGPAAQGSYTNLWLARCVLIASSRSSRISRLVIDEEVAAAQFAQSFPDAGGWVRRLWRSGRYSVRSGLQYCGFGGPPELFSMIACFCADPAVQRIPAAVLAEPSVQAQLSKLRAAYHRQHEQAPHPAVLLQLWAQQASPTIPAALPSHNVPRRPTKSMAAGSSCAGSSCAGETVATALAAFDPALRGCCRWQHLTLIGGVAVDGSI